MYQAVGGNKKKSSTFYICLDKLKGLFVNKYLEVSEYIDWNHPEIVKLAKKLASNLGSDVDIAKECF